MRINVPFKESKMKRAGVSNTEGRCIKDNRKKNEAFNKLNKWPASRSKYVKST